MLLALEIFCDLFSFLIFIAKASLLAIGSLSCPFKKLFGLCWCGCMWRFSKVLMLSASKLRLPTA